MAEMQSLGMTRLAIPSGDGLYRIGRGLSPSITFVPVDSVVVLCQPQPGNRLNQTAKSLQVLAQRTGANDSYPVGGFMFLTGSYRCSSYFVTGYRVVLFQITLQSMAGQSSVTAERR